MQRRQPARAPIGMRDGPSQRRHRPDYQIVLFVGLLMLFGLILMYAIGPQRANVLNALTGSDSYNSSYFAFKQFVSLVLSIGAFALFAMVPFTFLKNWSERLVWIGLGLSVLLFVTGNVWHIESITQCSLGACRWFNVGFIGSFQPAELLKLALLIYLARFLSIRHGQGLINDWKKTIWPAVGVVGVSLFFVVVLQKDLGTGLAISAIFFAIMVASNVSWKILTKLLAGALIIGVLMIATFPHRMERIITFFQSDSAVLADADGSNYHIQNAKIALGSGGLLGLGIGNSVQSSGYLPEAINDSIFAIIGEIFGFVGAVVVILLFSALLLRLLRSASLLQDMSMRLVVAGVWGWLAAHTILNIASMIGVFPLTGITLPLLSFGGTSMLFISAGLGLAFQLSRYTAHRPIEAYDKKEASRENLSGRRRIGGARLSSRHSN